MSRRQLLTLLGLVLIVIGLFERGWFFMAVWLGCDFLALAIAHARGAHGVLRQETGRLASVLGLVGILATAPLHERGLAYPSRIYL